MPSFQRSVAVLPLLLHKFRKNSVSAVRITLLVSTIPLRRCRSHLPLCHNCRSTANRIESYFCRSAVAPLGGQPISVLVMQWQNGKMNAGNYALQSFDIHHHK